MDNAKTPNTDGLKAYAQSKKYITLKKVDTAIQKLIKDKGVLILTVYQWNPVFQKHICITIKESVKELKHYESSKKAYLHQRKKKNK